MRYRGVHVGKIIQTPEDLIAHSYPAALLPPVPAPETDPESAPDRAQSGPTPASTAAPALKSTQPKKSKKPKKSPASKAPGPGPAPEDSDPPQDPDDQ